MLREKVCLDGSMPSAVSKRVCKHMNDDHAASCLGYAWSLAGITSATSAKLTAVNSHGFDLLCATSATDPDGNTVQITSRVAFKPPLKSDAELRERMVALHKVALEPKIRYLLPPLASLPLSAMTLLAATVWNPTTVITSPVHSLGILLLRSRENYQALLVAALAIHTIEASVAAWYAKRLKLPTLSCLGWFGLTLAGGNGTLQVLQQLWAVQCDAAKKA